MYTKLKKSKRIGEKCLLCCTYHYHCSINYILVLNQRYSNSKIDTEVYARKQLIKKNKALSAENAELRSQMLSSNNDVGHHAYKNAKKRITQDFR